MAGLVDTLSLLITADGSGMVNEFKRVGSEADQSLGKSQSQLDKVGNKMTSVGTTMMAGGALATVAMWKMAGASSDLNEEVSQSEQIFDSAAGKVQAFGKDAAQSLGQSERAAIGAANTFGLFFTNAGKSADEAADMSLAMTTLASDMASFKNTTPEEAVEALGAALRGESEPIRRYGVMLDEATLKQRALDMGLTKSASETLPPAVKMQAAYAEILAQTSTIQGDFARTSDGAANAQRIAAAEAENAKAAIGEGFVPVMTTATKVAGAMASGVSSLNDATGGLSSTLLGYGAVGLVAVGALSSIVGQALKMRETFAGGIDVAKSWGTAIRNNLGATAGIGAALGVGVLLYQNWAAANAEATAKSDEFTGSLDQQTGAITDATKALQLHQLESTGATGDLAAAGLTLDDFTRAVEAEGSALMNNGKLWDLYSLSHGKAAEILRQEGGPRNELLAKLAEEGQLTPAVVEALRLQAGAYDTNAEKMRTRNEVGVETISQDGKIASSSDTAGAKVRAWADGVDELNRALKEQQDAERALLDPQFAMIDASQKLTDAQNKYIEVSHYGQITNADTQQALIDVAKASADVDYATRNLTNAYQTGTTTIDQTRDTLKLWVDQGKITKKQADDIAWALGITKQKADELAATRTQIQIDTAAAMAKLEALLRKSGELTAALEARGIDRTGGDSRDQRTGPARSGFATNVVLQLDGQVVATNTTDHQRLDARGRRT